MCERFWTLPRRSQRVEQRRDEILSIWEARKDITRDELQAALKETGLTVSRTSLHRFFARHGITRKKRLVMRSSRIAPTS